MNRSKEKFTDVVGSGTTNMIATQHQRLTTLPGDYNLLTNMIKDLEINPEEWYTLGGILNKILRERLFRRGGFHSFSDFCARGLGYSRQHIYKLIKLVKFIDRKWLQATGDEDQKLVERLYALGFTKLYIVHALPNERLAQLLKYGLESSDFDSATITLESATIEQLRRALARQPSRRPAKLNTPATKAPLLSVLISQSQGLLEIAEQCQQNLDNRGAIEQDLHTLRTELVSFIENFNRLIKP